MMRLGSRTRLFHKSRRSKRRKLSSSVHIKNIYRSIPLRDFSKACM